MAQIYVLFKYLVLHNTLFFDVFNKKSCKEQAFVRTKSYICTQYELTACFNVA